MPELLQKQAVPLREAFRDERCPKIFEQVMTQRDWDFILHGELVLPVKARPEFRRAANKVVFLR